MKYTIWKIDDSRRHYTDAIESKISFERVHINCVNARNPDELSEGIAKWNLEPAFERMQERSEINTTGEIGVWLTFLNTMEYIAHQRDNVMTFEDDAILNDRFMDLFNTRYPDLPIDFDFFSLFIPRDHDHWVNYRPDLRGDGYIIKGDYEKVGRQSRIITNNIYKPWQRYGGVSMLWSPYGAAKVLSRIKVEMFGQWDEYVYSLSRLNILNGFTSNPDLSDLVRISGKEDSLVH